jgi:hypothetical protein
MEKNVKKKGRLKMALFTFSGGVHTPWNALA